MSALKIMRFSLASLLLFVTATAFIMATILSASTFAEIGVQIFGVFSVPVAMLLGVRYRGSVAAFWLGYAAFGLWSFVVLRGDIPFVVSGKQHFERSLAELLEPTLARIHSKRIDAEVPHHLIVSYGKPALPGDELKRLFPQEWDWKTTHVREKTARRSARIAWSNLQIAIALLGAALTRLIAQQKTDFSAGVG